MTDRIVQPRGEWLLSPGDVIKRTVLHQRYGGRRQGGISPSRQTPNVFVFTDRSVGAQHGYLDRWEGTTLHYTGEGQRGDQVMAQGNKAILGHVEDGRTLRVFEGSGGEVVYVGEFGLDPAEPWYYDRAPATGGGPTRGVLVFRLIPVARFHSEGRGLGPSEIQPTLDTPYVPVEEDVPLNAPEVFAVDPEVADRGRRGHRVTQNAVAEWARVRGFRTVRPTAGEPPFDVGWWVDDVFHVVEVKSLTPANERHQLRLGLGQVLDYTHQLKSRHVEVTPILALERRPSSEYWEGLCAEHGVALVWPESLDLRLGSST